MGRNPCPKAPVIYPDMKSLQRKHCHAVPPTVIRCGSIPVLQENKVIQCSHPASTLDSYASQYVYCFSFHLGSAPPSLFYS